MDKKRTLKIGIYVAAGLFLAYLLIPYKMQSWSEEVQLRDGSVITVKRRTLYKKYRYGPGWQPDTTFITIPYPRGSGESITWETQRQDPHFNRTTEKPLYVDYLGSSASPVVITINSVKIPNKYYCIYYATYIYSDGKWTEEKGKKTIKARKANLIYNLYMKEYPGQMTLEYKRANDYKYHMAIHRVNREIGPEAIKCNVN